MIDLVLFILTLFGAPERVKHDACSEFGGYPMWQGGMCVQTLASCRDRDGWLTMCPDSIKCSVPHVQCLSSTPPADGQTLTGRSVESLLDATTARIQ